MPLILALRRQKEVDLWVQGQPGLQSEFQDSQDYTEKPCIENKQTNKQTKQTKTNISKKNQQQPSLVLQMDKTQRAWDPIPHLWDYQMTN